MTNYNHPGWDQFATPAQQKYLDAFREQGSQRKAAESLGVNIRCVERALSRLRKKAAIQGFSPEHDYTRSAPYGHRSRGNSTMYNSKGEPVLQWVKHSADQQEYEEFIGGVVSAWMADIQPVTLPPFQYANPQDDIIPWFQIGDAHLGMVAWMREVGHNFDLQIGVSELLAAFQTLLEKCEPGKRCVINDLGDGTHYENFRAETEASGNPQDADGRFPKMIDFYIAAFKAMIQLALTKFEHVDVIINQGNHSRTNDVWMSRLIREAFGETGRVTCLPNDSVFIPYKMGNTFVVTHHSDKARGPKLAEAVLRDYPDAVKDCRFIYVDTGHIHHRYTAKEYGLVEIESWNNLAPNDKWHHEAGWRSKQSMSVVLRSRTYGEIGRHRAPIEMVHDRLMRASSGTASTSAPCRAVYEV